MTPPIDPPQLTDGELSLRAPRDSDVPRIVDCCGDADIQRYTRVPSPYTEQDGRGFVRHADESRRDGSGLHLAVVDADDTLLGVVGVGVDRADLVGEVGYWVAPDARGRGVATRATRLVCRFAFDGLGLARVSLHAAATNPGSNAVARRLGFTHEATLRCAMLDGPSGDATAPRCDAFVWGLLPGELR